jgi:hypothetical protein
MVLMSYIVVLQASNPVNDDVCCERKTDIFMKHNEAGSWRFCLPSMLIKVNSYSLTWYPLQTNIMVKWIVCLFQISGQISATLQFPALPEPSRQLLWQHLKLGRDCHLPNPSEFIIHKINTLKSVLAYSMLLPLQHSWIQTHTHPKPNV